MNSYRDHHYHWYSSCICSGRCGGLRQRLGQRRSPRGVRFTIIWTSRLWIPKWCWSLGGMKPPPLLYPLELKFVLRSSVPENVPFPYIPGMLLDMRRILASFTRSAANLQFSYIHFFTSGNQFLAPSSPTPQCDGELSHHPLAGRLVNNSSDWSSP